MRNSSHRLTLLCALALPWAMLCWHLSVYWDLSPQYEYGWMVPPLAAYLFFRRWKTMPEITSTGNAGASAALWGCALLLAPVWLVRTATPDWSVVSYCLAGLVVGLTLACLARMGGWGMARYLAFPVLFIFCAVPWPQRIENALIQLLMRAVAAITTEIMQWIGIAAEQKGNLVSLGQTTIGISEACSGVRSIQAMLMASLFLGELRRFKAGARAILVVCGFALALFFNLVRNVLLVLVANYSGSETFERWHDSAGWSILVVAFLFLLLVARKLGKPAEFPEREAAGIMPLPRDFALGLVVWCVVILGGNEQWYRGHEKITAADVARLEIRWPREAQQYRQGVISDRARDLTLCSGAENASWMGKDGRRWALTSLRWDAGRTASQSARLHQPDICLQAVGAVPMSEMGAVTLPTNGGEMEFRVWLFQYADRPLYVFYTLWEEANYDRIDPAMRQDWSAWSRIQRALAGQRNLGQQSVEIAIEGCSSREEAIAALREDLASIAIIRK